VTQCCWSLTWADNVTRIGPRKLCRVLRYVRDSTITRQPSDFGPRSSRVHEPSPTTIRGDTSQRKTSNHSQESYFELPHGGAASNRSSLITPLSFMQASVADSPDAIAVGERRTDAGVEQPSPNADLVRRELILLVEDNAINMRVSRNCTGCDLHRSRPWLGGVSMASAGLATLLPDCTSPRTIKAAKANNHQSSVFTSVC